MALAKGKKPAGGLVTDTVNNGSQGRPVRPPRRRSPVTEDNVKDTVVKDGFWKPAPDLHRRLRSACTAAGIQ